jgi:hypothetical protein
MKELLNDSFYLYILNERRLMDREIDGFSYVPYGHDGDLSDTITQILKDIDVDNMGIMFRTYMKPRMILT